MIENGLQYTITGANGAGSLTINPTNFSGDGLYLRDISHSGDVMNAGRARPAAHGSILAESFLPGIKTGWDVLALYTASTSARQSGEDTLLKVIASMLDADGSIQWTPQDGSADRLLQNVRAMGVPKRSGRVGPYRHYGFELQSSRAYVESATQTTTDSVALTATGGGWSFPFSFPISFTSSGGGTLTVPNAGNAPSYPVMRIVGPITNPVITKTSTQEKLSFVTSVSAGDYIDVDLDARTAKLNGATDVRKTLDVSASSWFSIPAGGAACSLGGAGFDGSTLLRVFSRDAWRI